MTERSKSPGQIAYEEDVRLNPFYDVSHRYKRVSWRELDELARISWERDPTPRDCRTNGERTPETKP